MHCAINYLKTYDDFLGNLLKLNVLLIGVIIMVKVMPIDPLSFLLSRSRGDGKVTIGITGLWRLSDHSDAAF